ncbi:MAG: hypothetical protein COT74_11940 [Bdellovibrionales bacterium CG10_big_fil_rev_8_21_14_0_10_45_34]|nr:MAG: hypothetical protein COT74_11940 [Bdellovibrionales bacterium CG10_big_fil_rev_8_21_14_0_10_45_34]
MRIQLLFVLLALGMIGCARGNQNQGVGATPDTTCFQYGTCNNHGQFGPGFGGGMGPMPNGGWGGGMGGMGQMPNGGWGGRMGPMPNGGWGGQVSGSCFPANGGANFQQCGGGICVPMGGAGMGGYGFCQTMGRGGWGGGYW